MDFKTKTALCIARLYNSSACVFWLAQTQKEELNNWKMVTGVETSHTRRLCFLVEYAAFELGQALPGHLSQAELAAAALPAASSAVGTAGRCSQLEAAAPGSAGQWEILQGCELAPGECAPAGTPQSWAGSGVRGALAWPWVRGHCQGRTQPGAAPAAHRDAPRVLQHRTLQAVLQSTKGIAQQTCAHEKRKIASPLLSLNRILTWCFHNSSELYAITNLSIEHLQPREIKSFGQAWMLPPQKL